MSQGRSVQSDWIDTLTRCLQELVSFERQLESEMLFVRQRSEVFLGIRL